MASISQYLLLYNSPIGRMRIEGNEEGISALTFEHLEKESLNLEDSILGAEDGKEAEGSPDVPTCVMECREQLEAYFKGKRQDFDLKLVPKGTPFQQSVWKELLKVGFGKTKTYMDIARNLENMGAIRAVGAANGKNPISIIVPCHRIIGSNGKLTGYAGGVWRKKWLLEHEERFRTEGQMRMF